MFKSEYYVPNEFSAELQRAKNIRTIEYDSDSNSYEKAIILFIKDKIGGAVFNEKFKLIDRYSLRDDDFKSFSSDLYSYKIEETITYVDETVIWGGILYGHFGHFIADTLNRLWYTVRYRDKTYKLAFVCKNNIDKSRIEAPYIYEFFDLLGVDRERILILDRPTQFKCVIIPKQACYWSTSYNKDLFPMVYEYISSKIPAKKERKIYLSKSKDIHTDSHTINEEFFEEFFLSRGFKILYPEELSVYEQLQYIKGADEIACVSGTLTHFCLFANKKIKLICLIRSNLDLWMPYFSRQIMINIIKQVDPVFVDVSLNFLPKNFVGKTHLIGPGTYWRDFLHNEYDIDCKSDVFDYMDNAGIRLGSYLRDFATRIKSYKFGYISYYLSMLRTYDSFNYNKGPNSLYFHNGFSTNSYRYKSIKEHTYCIIRLKHDGSVKTTKGINKDDACHWIFSDGKLYLLNSSFQAQKEFLVYPMISGLLIKNRRYIGNSISNPWEVYELIEIQHKFIRILIKLLVNKRRYKKLKSDPERFFEDSKSGFIRFLGRFYI